MQRVKLSCVKILKKKNRALFRVKILLRSWFHWVSRGIIVFFKFIVNLSFGHKLEHCLLYSIIVNCSLYINLRVFNLV